MSVTDVVGAVKTVATVCLPFAIKHTKYVISPESSFPVLKEKLGELERVEIRLQREIDEALENGDVIGREVYEWQEEAKTKREEMLALMQRKDLTIGCFKGLVKIPSATARHKLAELALDGAVKVDGLCSRDPLNKGKISFQIHNGEGASEIKSVFIDLNTHTALIDDVFKALLSGDDIVGIHGIQGVGKTAVVRKILAKARASESFHKVETINVNNNLRSSIVNFLNKAAVKDGEQTKQPNKAAEVKDGEQNKQPNKAAEVKDGEQNKQPNKTAEVKDGEQNKQPNKAAEVKDGEQNKQPKLQGGKKDENTPGEQKNAKPPAAGNDKKRVLIIIDGETSEKIDLAGEYIDQFQYSKNFKVQFLLASQKREQLVSYNCHPILPLNSLADLEAELLLTKLVGSDKTTKLGPINHDELRKRCRGLPFYIEALAQIIKRSNAANLWEDALTKLPNDADTIMEFNYNRLGDQVKVLYSLYAVLEEKTIQVQHILRYSVGIGLYDKVPTMEAERNKIREGLKSLINSSLLVGNVKDNQITIEDATRDVAVKCAFKSHYMHVFDGNQRSNLEIFLSHGQDSVPQKRKNKKKKDYSNRSQAEIIHDSVVTKFAGKWAVKAFEGRHVLVFTSEEEASIFISHSEARVDAPTPSDMESFFQLGILEKLKVVHLENLCFTTGLFPVEPRTMVLKDLVTLCLHNCHVKDMTGIGSLKSLQVLSFCESIIAKLLREVGELTKLRSLDFRECVEVEQIEPGALKGLSNLEELFLGKAFDKWEEDGVPGQRNASLAELNSMRRLATLDVCIPNPAMLPKNVAFSELERYSLHIGEWEDDSSSNETDSGGQDNYNRAMSRTLKLKLESSRVLLDGWFQATTKRAQQLHLEGLTDSKKSIHELCIGGGVSGAFEDLKHLEVGNCPSTHYVVRSAEWFERSAFTRLEFLSLDSLMNLEKIAHGRLSSKSFGELKTVVVKSCDNVKSLFSLSSIHGLSKLERIKICGCNLLEAIIVDERTEDPDRGGMLLDKTQRLTQPVEEENDQVSALPFKKSPAAAFSKSSANNSPLAAFSKSPGPRDTEEAKVVVKSKTTQKSAVAAAAAAANQRTDQVVSPDGKIIMHNLRGLEIDSSPNFSTFFNKLNPKMTESEREDKMHSLTASLFCGDNKISFPNLDSLALRDLEKLKEIWQTTGTPTKLDNLQTLEVERCTSLLSIFHPDLLENNLLKLNKLTIAECPLIQVVFDLESLASGSGRKRKFLPKLGEVKLTHLQNLKYIASNKYPRGLSGFENLSSLDVVGCGELEYIFTSSMAKAMKKLEHINVEDCAKMKAIVSDEVEDGEQVGSNIEFPALKVLKIDNCPDMVGFSRQSAKLEVTDKVIPSSQNVTSKGPKPNMMRYLLCCGNPEEKAPEVSTDRKAISEEPVTFFTQKVYLPSLEDLILYSAGRFTKIWPNEPPTGESFSKLSTIEVSYCKELDVAFPATILDRLELLRNIDIRECPSLRVLFELQHSNTTIAKRSKHVVFSHLKKVILSSLSKLEYVVEKDHQVLVGFPSLEKINVSYCDMLIDLMPVATATSLTNLETLTVSSCRKIEEVVGGSGYNENPLDDIVFPLLISLELRDLESLVHFSSATYQLDFPSLKVLMVENCMKMKIFSPVPTSESFELEDALHHHQSLFNERVGLPKLEELFIAKLKLKELWSIEPFDRSFWRLKLLQVEECNELQNVIQSFMLKRLQNLESLIVSDCSSVEHIVAKANEGTIPFRHLIVLKLKVLPKLRSFCSSSNTVEFPLVEKLTVRYCSSVEGIAAVKDLAVGNGGAGITVTTDSDGSKIQMQQPLFLFDKKIAFPNLKKLKITDGEELSFIFHGQVSEDGLSVLSDVAVTDCNKLVTMFNSNVLQTLTNLETLLIWHCELLKLIYDFCGDGSSDEKLDISAATATAKLSDLDIYDLPNLSHIWRYDPKESLNLERLSSVEIWNCQTLEYIFRASEAKRLFQLQHVDIRECNLEKIVAGDGEIEGRGTEDAPTFVFPKLSEFVIKDLDKLKSFSTGVYTVEWPLLSELEVNRCNSLDAFASDLTTFQSQMEQVQDSPTQKPLFLLNKDSFPHLKKLTISNCSNLKRIWQHGNNFTVSPFIRLTELELSDCSDLEEILFPTETLEIFGNLEKLNVQDCSSLKAIYGVHWRDQNAYNNRQDDLKCTTSELKLKEIYLSGLQDLEHIWDGELKGNISFENLSSVTIAYCQSLKYFFSAREAQDKEAVWAARTPKLLFPRVTSLELSDLPELISLYPGAHISRWPSLKKLEISNCTSIVKLRGDSQEKRLEGTATSTGTKTPLIWADKSTFCLLKELTLMWNDNMEQEWSGQLSNRDLFPKLQVLNLKGSGESFHLGSSFIHKVQIEKLTVAEASCKVLFQGGTVGAEVAHFTKLELNEMSKLIKIWEENYEHASMFKNLKSFQVSECHKLITLLPSPVFSNLASLVISNCNGLKSLMTWPTAKSLRQLSRMKISNCSKLEQIVEKSDGGSEEGAAFELLKYMEFSDLKSLTSFCSGKCKLSFPLLQELVVKRCPWIKRFSSSQALISTPKLKTVQTETGSLSLPERDTLNSALLQFFTEKLARIKKVDLSKSRVWRDKWFDEVPFGSFNKLKTLIVANVDSEKSSAAVPFDKAVMLSSLETLMVEKCNALRQVFETQRVNSTAGGQRKMNKMACFKNLRSITIRGCKGLKYILTTAMVLSLTLLERMHIVDCDALEDIVERQDEVKDKKELTIVFRKLETLRLENLPKLARFCKLGNRALNFPSLKRISIRQCDEMKTFTSEFLPQERPGMANKKRAGTTNLEPFFCDKVQLLSLEVLRLIHMHGLNAIWHGGPPKDSFSKLKEVNVQECPALKYLFPASVATNLLKLEKIVIKDCDGLEEIVAKGETANTVERCAFPSLTILRLKKLPGLKCFYPGIFHTLKWPLLKELEVSGCPKVGTLALEYEYERSVTEVQVDHEILPLFLIGKEAFPNLEKMTIQHMDNMKRIWHVHEVASKSEQEISESSACQEIEQVVRRPDNVISTFRQLESLKLCDLPSLVCFSSTRCTFHFSSLENVEIVGCPNMKFFSDGLLETPQEFSSKIQLTRRKEADEDEDGDNDSNGDEDKGSNGDEAANIDGDENKGTNGDEDEDGKIDGDDEADENQDEDENQEDEDDDQENEDDDENDEDEDEDEDEDDNEEEDDDDKDEDNDSDSDGDGDSEDIEPCHDLNATIKEKSNQAAMEQEKHDEDAGKDRDDIDDNNDDARRG